MAEPPGADRRRPARSSVTWCIRAPLAAWLREQAQLAAQRGSHEVLDVGCGVKAYAPFFIRAARYVGVDLPGNRFADITAPADAIPVDDASFDLVICLQVLEHVADPAAVVRELRRVVKPGGRVLASTHGVYVYHPNPDDLWRWTHTGLERLFRANGDWSSVAVSPGSGTTACVAMLAAHYVDLLFKRVRLRVLARPLVAGLNVTAAAVDRAVPLLRDPIPGSVFANYHVVADA